MIPMKYWTRVPVLIVVLALAPEILAHDTWIIPSTFRPRQSAAVQLRVATGEAFPSSEVAATPDRVIRYTMHDNARVRKIGEFRVEGAFLEAKITPELQGDTVIALELKPRLLEMTPRDFNQYLRQERQANVLRQRREQGASESPGRERYRKIAKTILCVGDGDDNTSLLSEGLLLEILPEQSPCTYRAWDRVEVLVFYAGQPLSNARVVAGYEGASGHHYPVETTSDADGRAAIVLKRPGAWFIRVLHIVPSEGDAEADWHSAFSTLTFEVRP
jgi:uncharacterized GH25 family protein